MAVRAAPLITCSYKGIGACSAVRGDRCSDGGAAWLPPALLPGGTGGPGAWLGAGVPAGKWTGASPTSQGHKLVIQFATLIP